MSPTLPRIDRADGVASLLAALTESGAVVVEHLLGDDDLAAIGADLDPHVASADPEMEHVNDVLGEFYRGVRNVTGLAAKSTEFVDRVLLHSDLLGVADAVIGPNCAEYSVNVAHLMVREPGAERQWIHRDEEVWAFLPNPHPEVQVASVIALSDFTPDNGATVVVPGSHRWPRDRRPAEAEVVAAEMSPGSAVVYLGSTLHAGGTNRTDVGRVGVHLSYVVGWLRPEENGCLAVPPDVARTLPVRAQRLLGYGMHDATACGGGYLGVVDLEDPVELLASGRL